MELQFTTLNKITLTEQVMQQLGFVRYQTVDLAEKGLFIRMVDYKIGIGVDE